MTKDQATSEARKLVKKLGKGWKIRVWENMGWHYSAIALDGHLTVHPSSSGNLYFCLLSDGDYAGSGSCNWYDAHHYEDPVEAVEATITLALNFAEETSKWTRKAAAAVSFPKTHPR